MPAREVTATANFYGRVQDPPTEPTSESNCWRIQIDYNASIYSWCKKSTVEAFQWQTMAAELL